MTAGVVTRKSVSRSHTLMVSGRSPVINEARDGLQTACWACACRNTAPDRASRSMFGLLMSVSPKTPSVGRRSSTAMNSTFGRTTPAGAGGRAPRQPHTATAISATPHAADWRRFIRRALLRERIRAELEMRGERSGAFAALDQPRRPIAVGRPQPASLPAAVRIVDAAVQPFRVEPERVRDAQHDHASVRVRDQAVVQVAGGQRHVAAEAEGVVLIEPRVVARLGAVLANAAESGTGVLMARPAFGALIAGGLRAVERPLALAPIEAAHVPARQRHPDDAVAVDVGAARTEAGQRR